MNRPVLTVENLSKVYRIGEKEEIPDTFVGALKGIATAPWRNFHRLRRLDTSRAAHLPDPRSPLPDPSSPLPAPSSPLPESDTLWALRDVSFDVHEGDVLGIIGRNGAGKSTLLKVLSRITEPTSGRVVIRGRVSSLLEVGTGFHPELTGRENIYLNGTILGMKKREIDRKFDEIVDFSGVEKFLDTPVKRYSSGMQVRLAFAVAAHLEPEILIVDEVLAVGDAEFQKKCIGKMQDVAQAGRTVLFVSHNMAAVRSLCSRGIVLQNGEVSIDSTNDHAIDAYSEQFSQRMSSVSQGDFRAEISSGPVALNGLGVSVSDIRTNSVPIGSDVTFRIHYAAAELIRDCRIRVRIYNRLDEAVCVLSSDTSSEYNSTFESQGMVECHVERLHLMPGIYRIELVLKHGSERLQRVRNAGVLEVLSHDISDSGKLPFDGVYYQPSRWQTFRHDGSYTR